MSFNRKARRKGTQTEIKMATIDDTASVILKAACKVLRCNFGRLRRKDTREDRFLEMVSTVINEGEI